MRITGTGSYIPPRVMTNFDFEKFIDTSDEWIKTRTGIERRHVVDKETNLDLSLIAAKNALEMAGIDAKDLGGIIGASVTNEWQVPSLACQLQRAMGADNALCFDVNAACSGFMFALKAARGIMMQDHKPILVVGSETLSRLMDYTDRSTCILFADGAGAVVLEEGEGFEALELYSFPDVDHSLEIPGINHNIKESDEPRFSYVQMNGQDIYKFATKVVPQVIADVLEKANTSAEDIAWVVAHQANIRILKSAARATGIPFEKWYTNIAEVGNTSSASVPIVLDEMNRKGLLKKGDKIVSVGFGGGLTAAGALITW